jgi:hypothetical protein
MKRIIFALLSTYASLSFADNVYLEPHYTVAIESATFESTNNTIQATTLTPIVYKKNILPSGASVTIACKNSQAKLIQLAGYSIKEPIAIGNGSKIQMPCDLNAVPSLLWSNDDEYKVKSDAVKEINAKGFNVIPFTANHLSDGQITSVTTDGNLTNIIVNKSRYFNNPQFFATIDGKMYFIQSSNDDDTYTIHAANMQKLLVTDGSGQLLATVEFPSYE